MTYEIGSVVDVDVGNRSGEKERGKILEYRHGKYIVQLYHGGVKMEVSDKNMKLIRKSGQKHCEDCGKVKKAIRLQGSSQPNKNISDTIRNFKSSANSVFKLLHDLDVDRYILKKAQDHYKDITRILESAQQEIGGFFSIIEQKLNDEGYGG